MHHNLFQVTARSLSCELPHGEILFSNIFFTLGVQKCGLVGPNGVGKTTLAKMIAGIVEPTSGEIVRSHPVFYLAQHAEPPRGNVAEYLMDLWDSPSVNPLIWNALLRDLDLNAELKKLSGGEWTRVRTAEALSRGAGLLILDEPTNNLDSDGRRIISDFLKNYQGAILVISHDRELLNDVETIWEMSNQGLSVYGGNFSYYRERKAAELELQEVKLERARKEKKKIEREYHEKLSAQEKRMARGERVAAKGGIPKIVMGALKRRAQQTHGKINATEEKRVENATESFKLLHKKAKLESSLGLEIPDAEVPEEKLIFSVDEFNLRYGSQNKFLWEEEISMTMKGPRRWALAGANGSGKSSLIHALLGIIPEDAETRGSFHLGNISVVVLDQKYALLDPERSILENIMDDSRYDLVETRNKLARFQFMKEKVHQPVATLSGGEKLKASLAKIFLQKTPPQLLILDEPTNNLDLPSLETLEAALNEFTGALLVISHDEVFLQNIGIEEVYVLQS